MAHASRGWHIALWIVQVLLAVAFGMAGSAKVMTPLPELAQSLPYTADLPGWLVRFIGAAEVAGALGLVLPALTRIQPRLTWLAALGLMMVMLLAALFHVARAEFRDVPVTVALGVLAWIVLWGRTGKAPIAPRPPPGPTSR